ARLAITVDPFLPFTAEKLRGMLNLKKSNWSDAGSSNLLSDGHSLGEASLLFEKIEDEVIQAQIKKLVDSKKAMELSNQPVKPAKAEVSFDEFAKMDIRIGTVITAERVEKSKKLLKLQVDTGIDKRTVMSGIAEHFSPEDITGKQVTILVNLAPRKIMGVESQGMILMAADKDGKLRLLQPNEVVSPGSTIS
ncbi:MAG: methionine--tRNA ligase subunit beta, partial [Cyclobacteriaceae bacterium]|nr:methionine--tRNA ligase subunit beta [Cyclobacteriaceae bacterium]